MKKLLLILLCLPLMTLAQQTYVPDNWFEAYLENNGMGNGVQYDDSVFTAAIDTVTYLDLSYGAGQAIGVFDLTGIEDFTNLKYLDCSYNLLTSLDLSQNTALEWFNVKFNQLNSLDVSHNTALTYLFCENNQLATLDLRNGNNTNVTSFKSYNNSSLTCINVDNASYSDTNWTHPAYFELDPQHYFSNNCSGTAMQEQTTNKELLRTIDVLGRETQSRNNTPLFYIYDDGTIEKRIVVE